MPPFEIAKVLAGGAVVSNFDGREYFTASPKDLYLVSREAPLLAVYLGALGMTGMTARARLKLVGGKAGGVIFISGPPGMGPGNRQNCTAAKPLVPPAPLRKNGLWILVAAVFLAVFQDVMGLVSSSLISTGHDSAITYLAWLQYAPWVTMILVLCGWCVLAFSHKQGAKPA